MANIYDINWFNVGRNLTFWRWRNTGGGVDAKLSAYIRSVMASVQVLGQKLFDLNSETVDFLQYTGQHKVLEEFLNDKYDSVQRRIFIVENNIAQFDPIAIGISGEAVDILLVLGITGDTVTTPVAIALSTEVLQDSNFTINIPTSVIFNQNTLQAQLRSYVLAGKIYNIVTF